MNPPREIDDALRNPPHDEVERFLRERTTWPAGGLAPEVWRRVLDAAPDGQTMPSRLPTAARLRRVAPMALAAVLLLALGLGVLLPSLGKARQSSPEQRTRIAARGDAKEAVALARVAAMPETYDGVPGLRRGGGIPAAESMKSIADPDRLGEIIGTLPRRENLSTNGFAPPSPSTQASPSSSAPAPDRLVIRHANIELLTPDVRAAFAKAQHLLRADLSEFVEASSLTGEGEAAQAQLTLRVAAAGDRLGSVLNELRQFGKVTNENSRGDDVTAQAVDLDARLRNERRVETEVLALVETRKDAPLKEILDLRDKLSQIRQEIEQLQGRRDTLGRQVALATILVIIRAEAQVEPPKPAEQGLMDQVGVKLGLALKSGGRTLVDSLAFVVEVLVAGALWWVVVVVALLTIRHKLAGRAKVSI